MKARDKKQPIFVGSGFAYHTTLPIVIFLLIALGWYMAERQARVLTQTTVAAYQQTEMEIVRTAARSAAKYTRVQMQYHPEGDVTEFEQEIFTNFIAPIHLLENGDAWIYAPDHVVFDLSADFPDRYRGKSMAEIFALQAENGASHYQEMTDAVMNAREGTGWYIWLPDKGKEIAAWTPVHVGDYVWTIGLSTPLPEILESTGAAAQIRTSRTVMGLETVITLALLAIWWFSVVERGRAEEALHESMEQLKFQSMLLQEVRDSITATDLGGRIVYMNRTSQKATGLTLEEARGQTTEMFGEDPQRGATQHEIVESTLRDGQWRGEVVNYDREGRETILDARTWLLYDEEGSPTGICGISSDITERKRAEEALRESEEQYRTLVENIPIGVYRNTPGPDGRFLMANPAFLRMFGFDSEAQLEQVAVTDLYANPDERKVFSDGLLDQSSITGSELRLRRRDGTLIWGSVTAQVVYHEETGEAAYFDCTIEDITERKRAEEALRRKSAEQALLLDTMEMQVWYLTDVETYGMVNRAHSDFLGMGQGDIEHRRLDDFLPPEVADVCKLGNRQTFTTKGTVHTEEWYCDGGGERRLLSVTRTPKLDEDGNVEYVVCVGTDITERVQLEEQLRRAQKLEAVGILAGGVAHNFNNILTSVLGNINLAMLEVEPGSQVEQDLRTAERAARRAAELTRHLLAIGRKSQRENARPINFVPVCEEVAKLLRQTIDRRIEVVTHLVDDLWFIAADPGQLNQVLVNLCLNARDALLDRLEGRCKSSLSKTRPYGPPDETPTITIEAENVTIDEEYCRTHIEARPGRFVKITVSDNGCGMDADIQTRVFEPFFTTKEVGEGTGLGLAMVRSIVSGYGGWVNLYSEPGIGTTISVYVVCAGGATAPVEEECRGVVAVPTGSETILLVDDEMDILKLGRRILERQGYTVHLARDGQEALEVYRLEREHIDLVLLDLTMPKLSGQDVMLEILRLDPEAKIVLASGHSANGPVRDAMEDGAVAFVQKPFDAHNLARVIRNALDG